MGDKALPLSSNFVPFLIVLPPLPDTDSVSHGGVQGHGRGVEVCVSHMNLNKTHETLSRKAVAFQEVHTITMFF
jgi:hypothetical protein